LKYAVGLTVIFAIFLILVILTNICRTSLMLSYTNIHKQTVKINLADLKQIYSCRYLITRSQIPRYVPTTKFSTCVYTAVSDTAPPEYYSSTGLVLQLILEYTTLCVQCCVHTVLNLVVLEYTHSSVLSGSVNLEERLVILYIWEKEKYVKYV
jgi:hypothetical protein